MLDTFHSPESASGAESASSLNLNFARKQREKYPPTSSPRSAPMASFRARGTTTLFVEAPKGEFSFPPFLEAKVDVTTKHWFFFARRRTMAMRGP